MEKRDKKGNNMKYTVSIIAVMTMAILMSGCGKSETVEVPVEKENWAPEMVNEHPSHDANDGDDHSGHNH